MNIIPLITEKRALLEDTDEEDEEDVEYAKGKCESTTTHFFFTLLKYRLKIRY